MLKMHEQQVEVHDRRVANIARHDASCQTLLKVEGIGPLTATALVATAGNGRQFKNGRHLSAYLGLVPGHSNTGNKTVMLPIAKRGSRYLRTLLVHGARSTLYHARRKTDPHHAQGFLDALPQGSRPTWDKRIRTGARDSRGAGAARVGP